MKRLILTSLLTLFIVKLTFGQKTDSVNCYIQLQDLWDLDLNRGTIMADFYLNLEYKHKANRELHLLNGSIIKIDTIISDDTIKKVSLRVNAELRTNFKYDKFPLDNQKIGIEFEPYQYLENLVLYSEEGQNILVDTIHLNGWKVNDIRFIPKTNRYKIYEGKKVTEYSYSSVYFEIPIIRENKISYFLKTFLPSIVSILILYVGFVLGSNQIDMRLNLAIGSLIVLISNFVVTQNYLPDLSLFTVIEKLNIGSLIIALITILFFALSYKYKDRLSKKEWTYANVIYILITAIIFIVMLLILLL
jgi:hypothetical protein